jgi:crossover junction endodeoxyribonuclease RuvC
MRVLGIDCGTAITGWAVLERSQQRSDNSINTLGYGVIRTEARREMSDRLNKLYEELSEIIQDYKPDCAAIESLFYFKNQKTVMSVGQARGVSILAAARKGLGVYNYTPLQVKQAVSGYGKAAKSQIQRMVKILLSLKELPRPDDAADALAIAICHINTSNYEQRNKMIKGK